MNLDEARYSECGASGRLEKPFDVSTLRGLVQKLVPKTQTQPLSSYLDLADMPPFEDDVAPQQAQVEAKYKAPIDELTNTKQEGTATSELDLPPPPARGTTKTSIPEPTEPDEWTMESFVSIEETMSDFPHDLVQEAESASSRPVQHGRTSNLSAVSSVGVREIELEDEAENSLTLDAPSPRPTRTATPELPQEDDSLAEGWGYQNLAKFKVKLPSEEVKSPETKHAATAKVKQPEPIPDVAPRIALSKAEIEALVREEAKKLIEGIVWKVVPEVAHNLVSQEIERLLKETKSEPPTL